MSEAERFVFQVQRFDGTLDVVVRKLIGRRGSWYEYELPNGDRVKENGYHWHDTVESAIYFAARMIVVSCVAKRWSNYSRIVEQLCELIDVAICHGEIVAMSRFKVLLRDVVKTGQEHKPEPGRPCT